MQVFLEILQHPTAFFSRLKTTPVHWQAPALWLFVLFVLTTAVPLMVGVLQPRDLLASLIFNGVSLVVLLLVALLLARGTRVLEVVGYGLLPFILAVALMGGLWFLGEIGRNVGSVLTFAALILSLRRIFIGLSVVANPSIAWRTIILAPLLTFLFMAVPFGLVIRWIGLA
ncbi:MAG: hypothetical protein ACK41E_07255 [Deinococcales bacterium]